MRHLLITLGIALIVGVLGTSCSEKGPSEAGLLSYEFDAEFAKLAATKYQLVVAGVGGSVHGKIRKIDLYFAYYGKMNTEEARELIVHLTRDCMEIVKANEKTAKYVELRPSLLTLFDISVRFETKEIVCQNKGFYSVFNYRGEISYYVHDPKGPNHLCSITFLEETFGEAERIVAEGESLDARVGSARCIAY